MCRRHALNRCTWCWAPAWKAKGQTSTETMRMDSWQGATAAYKILLFISCVLFYYFYFIFIVFVIYLLLIPSYHCKIKLQTPSILGSQRTMIYSWPGNIQANKCLYSRLSTERGGGTANVTSQAVLCYNTTGNGIAPLMLNTSDTSAASRFLTTALGAEDL